MERHLLIPSHAKWIPRSVRRFVRAKFCSLDPSDSQREANYWGGGGEGGCLWIIAPNSVHLEHPSSFFVVQK